MSVRYTWWGYARKMIYVYPERCRQHLEWMQQKVTANGSGMSGGSDVNRGTESVVLKAMSKNDYAEYKAVYDAIAELGTNETIKLLTLLFWQKRKRYTIYGAAMELHMSERTANRRLRAFIYCVGKNYGFLA